MPSAAFTAALPFVLRWEGGYVNHPNDPGGATNKGVTQRVYDRWRQGQGLPTRDVKLLGDAEMAAIYETGYWTPPRCDLLRRQLDLLQFDTAVNMGPKRAVTFLQQSLGCAADGAFGSATKAAVERCDPGAVVTRYCETREAFYRQRVAQRPDQGVFLKGWLNRLNALRQEVGLPGFEARMKVDRGDAGYVARIPDEGEEPPFGGG